MTKSESIGELTKALVKVQSEIKPASKSADNPFFKSKYADINAVWDSCRELLTKNGLAVIQTNSPAENAVIVETTLAHVSGEWISGELLLPLSKHDAQGVGSAITYGRRYGLAAIVGIVADADDDGNHASGNSSQSYPAHSNSPANAYNAQAPKQYAPATRPATGKASSPDALASAKQLGLLRAKARELGADADEISIKAFPDVSQAGDLSKQAMSWLIDAVDTRLKEAV